MATERIRALDGLRGLAAVVVILHHVLLVDNWFANALLTFEAYPSDDWKAIVYFTPLHIFFAGTEAVLVFFMLSGIVLVRAFPGFTSLSVSYFVSRLTRLYLPIWGSIVFALLLTFARPDRVPPGISWWLLGNYQTVTAEGVLTDSEQLNTLLVESAVLINYSDLYSNWLNSSLWSMKIEIVASILLFVFVLGSKRPVVFLVLFAAAVFLLDLDPVIRQYLQFLMFFAAGAWLAVSKIRASRWVADGLIVFSVLAFTTPWMLRGASSPLASGGIELLLGLVGAIALGFGVLGDSSFKKLLETRPFQYLGSRSYSIYLVHAPVVTLVGFWVVNLTGSIQDWFTVAPLAVVLALLAGELFHWAVERPSLHVARRLRRSIRI